MDSFESGGFDLGIDLRGLNAGVSEQFLNLPQVGAASQHVGRKAVAERVGADVGIDLGMQGVAFD